MKQSLFLAAAAALALSSCRTTSMRVEANPVAGVNYASYKTYQWAPLDKEESQSLSDSDKQLRQAFVNEADTILARRGFTKVEQGASDLLVYARGVRMPGYRAVGQTPAYESAYAPSDEGTTWLSNSPANQDGYLTEETLRSIRFLISEPKTDRIVWRGKAFVGMDNNRAQAMKIADARILAGKLLDGFPPKN